jgi:type IV pilus assembly protein PilQ
MTTSLETGTMTRRWRNALAALATAAAALAAPVTAWAQNAIQAITSTQQGGTEVVRVELAQPLTELPTGFSVQTPPRIAVDLPGVSNALGRNSVEINVGNLRSVNVATAGERTRLVLNLRQAAGYRAQLQGNALLLVLDSTGPGPALVEAAPTFAPAAAAGTAPAVQALRDIDFRRGSDGAGRVIVALPNAQVGVDIRQQGQSLVVEFLRTALPEQLRRRLDVTDFGTPVRTISAFQSGERVRMVVEPTGAWEHSAYQTDDQFVLEVRPMVVDPNKLVQGPGFQGEKLSLNFQNIEVRALLQVIADFTNFNVVTSDTVTGNVTLRLKDVPWDQALDIILQSKGLGVRKNGNVLWIAPREELAAREQTELEARAKLDELEPTRTQAFQLNYRKAQEIRDQLVGADGGGGGVGAVGGQTARLLSPRGSVLAEPRTNQLFINDIPSKLEEIQHLISLIDIPARQVLIEARIVEADDSFGRSLGVRWAPPMPARRTPDAVASASAATTQPSAHRPARPARSTSPTRSSSACRPTPPPSKVPMRPRLRSACSAPRSTASSTWSSRRWRPKARATSSPARA